MDTQCNDSCIQFKARKFILERGEKTALIVSFYLKSQSYLRVLVFLWQTVQ